MQLDPFLEAYEWTTGDALWILERGENPDFICARSNGDVVGLELTKVMRRRDIARWERVLDRKEEMTPYDMLMEIQSLIEKKDGARKKRDIQVVYHRQCSCSSSLMARWMALRARWMGLTKISKTTVLPKSGLRITPVLKPMVTLNSSVCIRTLCGATTNDRGWKKVSGTNLTAALPQVRLPRPWAGRYALCREG